MDDLIKRFKINLVALTLGERGSVLMSQEGRYVEGACDVEVVDTVGAGDAFSAVMVIDIWGLELIE